jgi:acetyl-CoA carboxylase biotin carboxyl carrier protein
MDRMTDPGLTADDVRRILQLVDDSHYGELRLEIGDLRLYVRKEGETATLAPNGAAPAEVRGAGKRGAAEKEAAREETMEADESVPGDDGLVYVTAPMVGMFYRAPGPDQEAFVEPGADVAEDDVVCLIEVMKLFSSITAGTKGRVKEVLAENGAMVEYGQRLLAIEPAEGA